MSLPAMINAMDNTGGAGGTQGIFTDQIQPLIDVSGNKTGGMDGTQDNLNNLMNNNEQYSSSERSN